MLNSRYLFILFATIHWAVTGVSGLAVAADLSDTSSEQIRGYQDIGRIKWNIPPGEYFYFAVPHFTVGPRIKCGTKAEADCEIQVSARQLTVSAEQRKSDLIKEMKPFFPDAVENSPTITPFGPMPSVEYLVLTHKKDGGKIVKGHYVNGPFVIKFHFVARDQDGSRLERVLTLIRSATALDGSEFLAFKLTDFKVACEELSPEFKKQNQDAFTHSRFAKVDYTRPFVEAYPSKTEGEIEALLLKARQAWIDAMRKWQKEEIYNFCRSYPTQVSNAEN